MVKNLPAMWETWVLSLGWEDPLEKGKATHSSILAWKIQGRKESDTTERLSLSLPPHHCHQFPWHKHYLLCITKKKYCIDPVHWSNETYRKSKSPEQQHWSRTASGGFSHCYVSRKNTQVGFSPCQFQTKTLRRRRTALWLTQPRCTPRWPALPFPVLL